MNREHTVRTSTLAALAAVLLLTGCGGSPADDGGSPAAAGAGSGPAPRDSASPTDLEPREPRAERGDDQSRQRRGIRREIPGIGPRTHDRIDPRTRQVFVVTGRSTGSNRATAVLYERDRRIGWQPVSGPWRARNALKGWTGDHRLNDLRTPIGVYGLTDAGGRLPDPGTELPYDQGPAFTPSGVNFEGESLTGAFDHVVAVNYNREPGSTPLDWTRPLGVGKGGGIWIHVDHGGATKGCVTLARPQVAELLKRLDPEARPVVVMGPERHLAR
ncbi:L,D-transpeptidase family protein [Streptomyces jumonjinensis]|uniref:L,D-TPase catalytic domain-containing protein n=1 Tax=Streptomyces jumonjinensis TaxID=1945 RepID=A0A646KRU6_STRJU|nr:L,D-transpeptidase family protein [Streptomyces jumonjinensis]MQT04973.1 hypothetical protein [Streptomyces jumonjinensis]